MVLPVAKMRPSPASVKFCCMPVPLTSSVRYYLPTPASCKPGVLQLTLLHAALLITVQARRASHIRQSRVPRQHRQGNRGAPVMRWRMWTRTSLTQLCMWTAPRLARYALLCTFLCQRDKSNGREHCKFCLRLAPSTCKVPAAACPTTAGV